MGSEPVVDPKSGPLHNSLPCEKLGERVETEPIESLDNAGSQANGFVSGSVSFPAVDNAAVIVAPSRGLKYGAHRA